MTKLPVPEQWALVKMNEYEVAEEIEKFIDYVDENGRSVHLPMEFVRHFMKRDDGVLPTVVAIATMPIILADGGILALNFNDIDKDRGIEFAIPEEAMAILPRREDCTPDAIKKAMKFLTDEWLCDVLTDYDGKCTLIAAAMTIIERSLLPERPAFFVTAGRARCGMTTALTMMIIAVTGIWPAAASWSTNEEERRKALLSYFLYGVPYIIWDNIKRGTQIDCPHVERSCTAAYYSDRKLGVSEIVRTAAATIHLFTGNNINARGDLASRSLKIRLEANRPDPENRKFKHPDVIGWTENNRAEILQAMYTILLGNPTLDKPRDAEMKTRYKIWWRLVGSAVEHATKLAGNDVDFTKLFLKQEEEDEDDVSLAEVLSKIKERWQGQFKASDVHQVINSNSIDDPLRDMLREFLCPWLQPSQRTTPNSVGGALKKHVGEPVRWGEKILILKAKREPGGGGNAPAVYEVEVKDRP